MKPQLYMTGASPDEVWPLIRDYHYSGRMPSSLQHCFVWREPGGLFGDFGNPVAAITYSNPSGRGWPTDAFELTRLVRVPYCKNQLSQFVSWSIRWLRANTLAPFVLSYADDGQGHHGGIYQACGFKYVALRHSKHFDYHTADGVFVHPRTIYQKFGSVSPAVVLARDTSLLRKPSSEKHLYIKPLRKRSKSLLKQFDWQELPFPKPNAARPDDAPAPTGVSEAKPLGAAPIL